MGTIKYPINEIFYSIQGEGYHVGKPAVFIRLAGCNLNCSFCDTDYSKKTEMTVEEIFEEVEHLASLVDFVVITGGEPTIHNLQPLFEKLEEEGIIIHMETNGVGTDIDTLKYYKNWVSHLTVSPKRQKPPPLNVLDMADEIKVIFERDHHPNKYLGVVEGKEFTYDKGFIHQMGLDHQRLYIQPCSEDFQPAVDFVLANPEWRLSIQIQKVIGVK